MLKNITENILTPISLRLMVSTSVNFDWYCQIKLPFTKATPANTSANGVCLPLSHRH